MTQPNGQQPQQEGHIASPNPTVDDSKTPTTLGPKNVTVNKVQPATTTTAAPLKKTTAKPKSKRKHATTKPHDE
jgi:hypothetical protein